MAASRFRVFFKSSLLLLSSVALSAGAQDSKSTAENAHEDLSGSPGVTQPCRDTPSLVSPEYPQPAYSTAQIAQMFKRPRDVTDLLVNLKQIFDYNLLVQPNFLADDTLLKVFNARSIRWINRGAPDFGGDRLVRPTKVARLSLAESFSDITVDIGLNHECFNPRPDKADPTVLIPAHTYDSGYMRMRVAAPVETFTLGTVRRVFGPNQGHADPKCKEPFPLSYPTTRSVPDRGTFFLNTAEFRPPEQGYEASCKAQSPPELRDEEAVGGVFIRVLEDNHTLETVLQP
jgi:hypothetical protein